MKEKEWLSAKSIDPLRLWWRERRDRARYARKERLFACACARLWWAHMTDPRSRRAVEAAEKFADGLITKATLARARAPAVAAGRASPRLPRGYSLESSVDIIMNLPRDDVFVATTLRLRDAAP